MGIGLDWVLRILRISFAARAGHTGNVFGRYGRFMAGKLSQYTLGWIGSIVTFLLSWFCEIMQ